MLCGCGARQSLHGSEPKGVPSLGFNTALYALLRLFEHLLIKLLAKTVHEVIAGFDSLQTSTDIAAAGCSGGLIGLNKVAPSITRDGLQVSPEAAGRVIAKGAHLFTELDEDCLRHILGIGFLQVPAPTPTVNPQPITPHEFRPG